MTRQQPHGLNLYACHHTPYWPCRCGVVFHTPDDLVKHTVNSNQREATNMSKTVKHYKNAKPPVVHPTAGLLSQMSLDLAAHRMVLSPQQLRTLDAIETFTDALYYESIGSLAWSPEIHQRNAVLVRLRRVHRPQLQITLHPDGSLEDGNPQASDERGGSALDRDRQGEGDENLASGKSPSDDTDTADDEDGDALLLRVSRAMQEARVPHEAVGDASLAMARAAVATIRNCDEDDTECDELDL